MYVIGGCFHVALVTPRRELAQQSRRIKGDLCAPPNARRRFGDRRWQQVLRWSHLRNVIDIPE